MKSLLAIFLDRLLLAALSARTHRESIDPSRAVHIHHHPEMKRPASAADLVSSRGSRKFKRQSAASKRAVKDDDSEQPGSDTSSSPARAPASRHVPQPQLLAISDGAAASEMEGGQNNNQAVAISDDEQALEDAKTKCKPSRRVSSEKKSAHSVAEAKEQADQVASSEADLSGSVTISLSAEERAALEAEVNSPATKRLDKKIAEFRLSLPQGLIDPQACNVLAHAWPGGCRLGVPCVNVPPPLVSQWA